MLNMDTPTVFRRTRSQLEEFLMASVCVAGKVAHVQAARLDSFLYESEDRVVNCAETPFDKVRVMIERKSLYRNLVRVGMGKYHLISASFNAMVRDKDLNLREAPWERLTEIPGIKEKTAKFFVLHSRPDQQLAVLDTHMRKKLTAAGYAPPPFPPPNRFFYLFWQRIVLKMAERARQSPALFDLSTWKEYRRSPSELRSLRGQYGPPVGR